MIEIWNTAIFRPMLNGLLFLYSLLWQNFGLSIIVFTVLVRLLTLPMTMKQMRSTRKSQEMQPKLQELQKKYKDNKEKLAEEQMKLYKEAGINPIGCLGPMVIQMPIWIGLYQSISNALPGSPMQLLNLARHIYTQVPTMSTLVPLNAKFLWLDLGRPDPLYIVPIVVVVTMWLQQKMMATPSTGSEQQAMSQSMQITMPLMFGMITFQAASGLGLYFVVTNVVQLIQNYFISGWGSLGTLFGKGGDAQKPARTKDKRK